MLFKIVKKFIFILLFTLSVCHAETIKLHGKTVISAPTTYQNVDIDMTNGFFFVVNNASLTIQNSTIEGLITPNNPILLNIDQGQLILKNTQVTVDTNRIQPIPDDVPPYDLIFITQGNIQLENNNFTINQHFMAGLFATSDLLTNNFIIQNNTITNFHGGFYLTNTKNALLQNNTFTNTSLSNIFILNSSYARIRNNSILFAGYNNNGDGIDVINSDDIILKNNYILADSCSSLAVVNSQNILIDSNVIADGITYGIILTSMSSLNNSNQKLLLKLLHGTKINQANKNIFITNNYLLQNRYGMKAIYVTGLTVENNFFVQRFLSADGRQYWTNNDILLQQVPGIVWDNNWYKEGFSQVDKGYNDQSLKFVVFPLHGGIVL